MGAVSAQTMGQLQPFIAVLPHLESGWMYVPTRIFRANLTPFSPKLGRALGILATSSRVGAIVGNLLWCAALRLPSRRMSAEGGGLLPPSLPSPSSLLPPM
jgi:hypothetical protein